MGTLAKKVNSISMPGVSDFMPNLLHARRATFNIGDGTDIELFDIPAGTWVVDAISHVTTAMDGTSASIVMCLGDDATSDGYLATSDVAPYTANTDAKATLGGQGFAAGKYYASDDTIDLVVTTASSTTGKVEFVLFYVPSIER